MRSKMQQGEILQMKEKNKYKSDWKNGKILNIELKDEEKKHLK